MSFKNRDIVTNDEMRTRICKKNVHENTKVYKKQIKCSPPRCRKGPRAFGVWPFPTSRGVGGLGPPTEKNYARMRSL